MSEPFVDFAAVKARVKIEDVIPILGLTMKGNQQLRGPCPVCKGDPRALAINIDKQGFYCHSRSKGGDVIALTAHVRGTSQREAALFLQDHFGAETKPAPKAHQTAQDALQPLDYLETDHEVIELLGLSVAACEALGAGFAPKGTMAGRFVVPLRNEAGKLLGYFGVATRDDQVPLLLFPKNLDERVKREPEKVPADQLRKRLRVI
jgi:DNA primase